MIVNESAFQDLDRTEQWQTLIGIISQECDMYFILNYYLKLWNKFVD